VVSPAPPRQHLAELARQFTEQARDHGLSASEIIDLIAEQL
jgi:hypothetical protein